LLQIMLIWRFLYVFFLILYLPSTVCKLYCPDYVKNIFLFWNHRDVFTTYAVLIYHSY
jgi:hypothetical protein